MIALVALRLAIGWHFYKEGAKKLQDPNWSSTSFFWQAKGPFADYFKSIPPDPYFEERLDQENILDRWDSYRARAAAHYGYTPNLTDELFQQRSEQLQFYFTEKTVELGEYHRELARLRNALKEASTRSVDFQEQRIAKLEADVRGKARTLLTPINSLERLYMEELQALGGEEAEEAGRYPMPEMTDLTIDSIVPWMTIIVGVCLMLGLFTEPAAIVGALFLFSVCMTQWPWADGAADTYNQWIELFGLLVLAATSAGRFAGLDFFVRALWSRCCGGAGAQR